MGIEETNIVNGESADNHFEELYYIPIKRKHHILVMMEATFCTQLLGILILSDDEALILLVISTFFIVNAPFVCEEIHVLDRAEKQQHCNVTW